jgi:hypothetical protein
MNRCGVRVLLLFALVAPNCDSTSARPVLFLGGRQPLTIDLGPIRHEIGSLPCTVLVRNDTDATVNFTSLNSSCGCIRPILESRRLAPYETTILKVWIEVGSRSGFHRFSVSLTDESGRTWRCEFTTVVVWPLSLPEDRLNLGSLDLGMGCRGSFLVDVSGFTDEELPVIQEVRSIEGRVRAWKLNEKRQNEVGYAKNQVQIGVEVSPQNAEGEHRDRLRIVAKRGPASLIQDVEILWTVRGVYDWNPRRVFFGQVSATAEVATRVVEVRRKDGRPFELGAAVSAEKGLSAQVLKSADPDVGLVEIRLNPKAAALPLWSDVIVACSTPPEDRIRIPCAALP